MLQSVWPQLILVVLTRVYFYSLFENSLFYSGDKDIICSGKTPKNSQANSILTFALSDAYNLLETTTKTKTTATKQNKTKPNKQTNKTAKVIICRRENTGNVCDCSLCPCLPALITPKGMLPSLGACILLF